MTFDARVISIRGSTAPNTIEKGEARRSCGPFYTLSYAMMPRIHTYQKVRSIHVLDARSLEALEPGYPLLELEFLLKRARRPRQQLVEDVVASLPLSLGHDPRLLQEVVLDLQIPP